MRRGRVRAPTSCSRGWIHRAVRATGEVAEITVTESGFGFIPGGPPPVTPVDGTFSVIVELLEFGEPSDGETQRLAQAQHYQYERGLHTREGQQATVSLRASS